MKSGVELRLPTLAESLMKSGVELTPDASKVTNEFNLDTVLASDARRGTNELRSCIGY